MIHGSMKADGLVVARIEADFVKGTLLARSTFIDTSTGQVHGWTESQMGWSKDTLAQMEELRKSMEEDLSRLHFSSSTGSGASGPKVQPLVGGLSEHLGGEGDDADPA